MSRSTGMCESDQARLLRIILVVPGRFLNSTSLPLPSSNAHIQISAKAQVPVIYFRQECLISIVWASVQTGGKRHDDLDIKKLGNDGRLQCSGPGNCRRL